MSMIRTISMPMSVCKLLEKGARAEVHACLEGTAADSVSFILVLLVPRTQRELVDEVQSHTHLPLAPVGRGPAALVGAADGPNVVLHGMQHLGELQM